jgi:tetratricopeptide (TPR) repeat protein
MIQRTLLIVSAAIICTSYGPPNCNLYKADEGCYTACKDAENAIMFTQGSKESQEYFDKSIQNCPSFDYSFYEKAVPYAKRGLMKEWKIMIDEAIKLNPQEHLATRGWYHFFFMRNYEAAIKDIEQFDQLKKGNVGFTGDGVYHLNVLKALSWKGLGERQKAIQILTEQLNKDDHEVGMYDYLHLGVLYLEIGEYEKGLENLNKQIAHNDLSEVYFYKALCYKHLNKKGESQRNLNTSLAYYQKGTTMANPYRQLVDEIYLSDIEKEIALDKNE